jgi:hypothetical protein
VSPRIVPVVLVIVATALLACGCSGIGSSGKDVSKVSSCLKGVKLNVENSKKSDKSVKEGVFATSDLTKGDAKNITIAVAAVVKSDDTIKEFEKQNKDFGEKLKQGDTGKDLKVESGSDGRYVWVVMGNPSKDTYGKAKDCVKP